MSLSLYEAPNTDPFVAKNNPLRFTFNGSLGGSVAQQVYIRNDDPTRWYSDITIFAVDLSGKARATDAFPGYAVQLIEKDTPPTADEWVSVIPGNQLSMSADLGSNSIGDVVTYLPVWVRVVIPARTPIQTIKEIVLRITAREHLI